MDRRAFLLGGAAALAIPSAIGFAASRMICFEHDKAQHYHLEIEAFVRSLQAEGILEKLDVLYIDGDHSAAFNDGCNELTLYGAPCSTFSFSSSQAVGAS